MGEKKLLYEVSYIRPIVICLLVLLHCFEKISSGGSYERPYQLPEIYVWFIQLIKGFRIETIALVAGYVFAYQSIDLLKKYEFIPFVIKKIRRLILPMLFFGLIYYGLFYYDVSTFTVSSFFIKLFSGCGHLWFLPMLFWCFVSIWFIDRYRLSSWKMLLLLAILSIVPLPEIPLGFGRFPHFLFYVYAGYFLWERREIIWQKLLNVRSIIFLWMGYLLFVILLHYSMPIVRGIPDFRLHVLALGITNTMKFVESCLGTIALYLSICYHVNKPMFSPSPMVIVSSKVCYGIYVYHQFILVLLYFCTPLFDCVNEYLLPWIGFVLTMVISLALTWCTLQTKIGRALIG